MGPNSAPNGDGRLVKGYSREEFVYDKTANRKCNEETCKHNECWISLRDFLSRSNRLSTGKTR